MSQENLKKAIGVFDSAAEQAEKSFADGIQAKDFFDFVPEALAASQIDWKAAVSEAKDRTPEANQELVDFVKQDLTLTDAVAEQRVEAVVSALAAIDDVALAFKKPAA